MGPTSPMTETVRPPAGGLALFDPERQASLPTLRGYGRHLHEAFGLVFETPFPCPELFPSTRDEPDVVVRYGPVPAIADPVFNGTYNQIEFVAGEFRYNKTGVTRALVRDGNEIRLQRVPFVHDDEVRYTFLTIVMSALLLQRGILSLHASAISTPRGALLFVGRSGAGKSTLAAEFVRRGYRMQADDITPILLEGDRPVVLSGFPQLKLCLDAAAHLEQPTEGVARVRPTEDKLSVLEHDRFTREPSDLLAILRLEPAAVEDIEMQRLDSVEKFQTLVEYTFNQSFLDGLGKREHHFHQVVKVGHAADVREVRRPTEGYRLKELADYLESKFIGA